MRPFAIAAFVVLGLSARVVSAQPGLEPPSSPERDSWEAPAPAELSYGRSIAVSDAIAAGLMGTAFVAGMTCWASSWDSDSDDTGCGLMVTSFYASLGTYALVPAFIHLREDQPTHALASIGLRAGLPIAAGYLSYALVGDADLVGWSVVGGIGAAVAIDWLVLAKKPAPERRGGFAPTVMPTRGGATFGLGGQF